MLATVLARSSHLIGKHRKKEKKNYRSIRSGYYAVLSYDVTRCVFVVFLFANVEVICFNTFASDQSLALLHILHMHRATVTQFRHISMPAGFRRHLVGKKLRNVCYSAVT